MPTEPQAMIKELENRRFRAMCERDAETLEELLADGLIYTHSSATVDTKASYIAGIRSKKWEYKKVERPVEDIRVYGDCAVVSGEARIEAVIGGNPRTIHNRYLDVWVKSGKGGGKGWQMAAWQSTPIPAKA
jgi:ketosteroid isomerase-like protein